MALIRNKALRIALRTLALGLICGSVAWAGGFIFTPSSPAINTPEPASLFLLGTGMVAAGMMSRRKQKVDSAK